MSRGTSRREQLARHAPPKDVADRLTSDRVAEALYRRHEQRLRAWLAARIVAPQTLIEDACANAWLILLARPDVWGERTFGWLRTTALHEAYRLLRQQRREPPSDRLAEARPAFVPARRDDPETAFEARRALLALASLRARQRRYMAWKVAGFRYREVQALAGNATSYTNVNRHLTRARGALRQLAEEASERPAPRSE